MEPVYFNLLAHAIDLSVFFTGFTAGAIALLAGIKLAAVTTIPEEL